MSIIKDFLKDDKNIVHKFKMNGGIVRKHIYCKDGFVMSVQASKIHRCTPPEDLLNGEYTTVEVGISRFLAEHEDSVSHLDDFTNIGFRYGEIQTLVPIEYVDEVIEKHGGIATDEEYFSLYGL